MILFLIIFVIHESLEIGICVGNDPNNTVVKMNLSLKNCYAGDDSLLKIGSYNLPSDYCSINFSISTNNVMGNNNYNNNNSCFFPYIGYYTSKIVNFNLKKYFKII